MFGVDVFSSKARPHQFDASFYTRRGCGCGCCSGGPGSAFLEVFLGFISMTKA